MNRLPHLALLGIFSLGIVGSAHAQWTGTGAGGTGTDLGTTGNWTGGTVNGDFSSINTTGTYTVTADSGSSLTLTSPLDFAFTATGVNFTLGNGTASPSETLTLPTTGTNDIYVSGYAGTIVTLNSDLTLALGSVSAARTFVNYVVAASNSVQIPTYTAVNTPLVIIKSLITGSSSNTLSLDGYTNYGYTGTTANYGTPYLVLANDNNSYTGTLQAAGLIGFTSIANSGTNSSLGNSGSVVMTNGAGIVYVGTGNQTSNRGIYIGGGNSTAQIINDSSATSTLSLNFGGPNYGSGSQTLKVFTAGSNTVKLTGNIVDGNGGSTGTGVMAVSKLGSTTIGSLYNYTGQSSTGTLSASGNGGTLILSGANTYSAGTTIQSGILLVQNTTGSGTGIGTVAISGTGTILGGSGIIAPTGTAGITVASGSIIAPGSGAGGTPTTFTLDGGGTSGTVLTLSSGSTLSFTLSSGSTGDEVKFLNFASGDLVLNSNTLNFTNAQAGTYTLFQFYSDAGTTLATTGATSGLTLGTGLTGFNSSLSYTGGSIILTLTTVPEPSTWALLGLGAAGLALLARRKRAASAA